MKKRCGFLLVILAAIVAFGLTPCAFAASWSWDKSDPEFVSMIEEHKILRDESLKTAVPGVDYEIGTLIVSCYDCTLSEFEAFAAKAGFTIKSVYDRGYQGQADMVSGGYLAYPDTWTLRKAIDIAESYDIVAIADVNAFHRRSPSFCRRGATRAQTADLPTRRGSF